MHKIFKQTIVRAQVEKVYNAYANLETWKMVMDDIVNIKVDYDDQIHQVFDMTVKRKNGHETVRSIRFCFPFSSIEIFQIQPPPMYKSMSGVWTFEPCSEGTLLTALRNFEIIEGNPFEPKILEGFLERNLQSFKAWIEKNALCEC